MIKTVAIIGVGLIGGSFALACKKNQLAEKIIGCSRKQQTIDKALELGLIDEGFVDVADAVKHADLVVICTPLGSYQTIAQDISPHLKDGVIITDAGSVKDKPSKDFLSGLDKAFHSRFVAGHPIAGTEKSGPEAAFAELYEGKNVLLTPSDIADKDAVEAVSKLWQEIGANIEILDADRHDYIYAAVSHLVQFLSYAYSSAVSDLDKINLSADKNYKKFIRLCGSDAAMWRDIFIVNKPYLFDAIELFEQHLQSFAKQIEQKNDSEIYNRLVQSRDKRLHFHKILKAHEYTEFYKSDYSNLKAKAKIWVDLLPRIISTILMETIAESEYEHATGAGLQSLSKNIILDGAVNSKDLLGNSAELLTAIKAFTAEITLIKNAIEAEDYDDLQKIFESSQDIYNKITN